jgi:hypothetical protein
MLASLAFCLPLSSPQLIILFQLQVGLKLGALKKPVNFEASVICCMEQNFTKYELCVEFEKGGGTQPCKDQAAN